jgi:hypothetical protein
MPARAEARVENFLPSRNGFRFLNRFPGVPLPDALAALIDVPNSAYGLCGGMAFAVIDLFKAGRFPPPTESVPARDTGLFDYIAKRQLASFGLLGSQVPRFVAWMGLTEERAQLRTLNSWYELRRRLNRGELTNLGLIYVTWRESLRVWDNHQVLAYGYTRQPDGAIHLHLYDPNYPRDDRITIRATPTTVTREDGVRKPGLSVGQYRGQNKVRDMHGFFVMPYWFEAPPDSLTG